MTSPYIGKTLHYPKINHYHYEHGYLPDSARTSGNLTERDYVSSLSPFAPTSADYYMDCVTILTADESIHWFKLGLDFPAASYFIDRYEDVLTLKFVLSGKGTVYGKQCRAGDVFYTPPLVPQHYQTDATDPWRLVWLQVSGSYSNYLLEKLRALSPEPFLLCDEPEKLLSLAKFMIYEQPPLPSSDYIRAVAAMFFSFLKVPEQTKSDPEKQDSAHRGKRDNNLVVQQACDYVHRHLPTVTVSQLAELSHFDRKYFTDLFRKFTDISPQEYIIAAKLEYVRFFLKESDMPLEEIMNSVGYEHRNGLVTAFRKKYGMTPTAYRKAVQKTASDSAQKEGKEATES